MSERKRKVKIGPLITVGGCASEIAKVYRQARRDELDVEVASKLVYMLAQLRQALEISQLEERLLALEGPKVVPFRRAS